MVSIDQPLLTASTSVQDLMAAIYSRASAYVSLTKPRLVLLVLVTVAVGYAIGPRGGGSPAATSSFLATIVGTALVAGGAGALNQWIERERDARMRRTANRALPGGRLASTEAMIFGTLIALLGMGILLVGANLLAAEVALLTFVLYVFAYTPLKTRTTLNTAIGAIPGALPPVIGWSAATGRLGIEAWALFLIVFLWQFPHFLAIAWIYRDDYERAGFRMLSVGDLRGRMTGGQAVSYALALIPAGLLPAMVGLAGSTYFVGAMLLGCVYAFAAARFWLDASERRARRLLRVSFLYLPTILLLLLLNPLT
jgi:protoheme IX farnesyltransferase